MKNEADLLCFLLVFHAFNKIDGGLQNIFVVVVGDGLQSFVERHPGEVGDFGILFFDRFRMGESDEVDDFFDYAGGGGVADGFPESGAEIGVQAGFFLDFPQCRFDFRFAGFNVAFRESPMAAVFMFDQEYFSVRVVWGEHDGSA